MDSAQQDVKRLREGEGWFGAGSDMAARGLTCWTSAVIC